MPNLWVSGRVQKVMVILELRYNNAHNDIGRFFFYNSLKFYRKTNFHGNRAG